MKKTVGAKIYKVTKTKTKLYGTNPVTMYNLHTKNKNHSTNSNPYGLDMMKGAYLIPVKESVNEGPKIDSRLHKGLKKIQDDSYKLLANYRTVPGIQKLVKAWMDGLHRSMKQLGIMKESKELTKIDTMLKNQIKKIGKADKKAGMELMKLYKKHWVEFSINAKKHMNEGTCGYGVDGKLGEEPAGPHLLKKKKV